MKGFLVRAEDMFVCKMCEREGDEEDRNVEESLDLGNGVYLLLLLLLLKLYFMRVKTLYSQRLKNLWPSKLKYYINMIQ